MSRILVAECKQEISSFNPVIGTYDNFSVCRGPELLTYHQGRETELCGALQVFADSHVDVIPTYGAVAPSAGPLGPTGLRAHCRQSARRGHTAPSRCRRHVLLPARGHGLH